jgi:ATP-dependent RNA helicase DeaD
MKKFRDGTTPLLIATDVAARGLDIGHLSHVVNFGVPMQAEVYVHRIGRVGRAGRVGVAITVAEPREQRLLRMCEQAAGRKIDVCKLPTAADLRTRHLQRTRDGVRELLAAGELAEFHEMVAPLTAEFAAADVAAAAVAFALRATGSTEDEPDIPQPEMARPRPAGLVREPRVPFRGRRPGGPGMGGAMTRVFVGAGRRDGVGRRDMLDALGQEVGLTPRDIGTIEVADRFCVVEVPGEVADHVIDSLQGARFGNRKVVVRRDRAEVVRS